MMQVDLTVNRWRFIIGSEREAERKEAILYPPCNDAVPYTQEYRHLTFMHLALEFFPGKAPVCYA